MSLGSRRVAGFVLATVLATTLSGCGGSTTCNDYAGKSITDQTIELQSLLRAHHLDPHDAGNIGGVTRAVTRFCHPSGLGGGVAYSNGDHPLEDAVDWNATTWAP